MACCIIAALILAQITATLRRWAVFWGLVPPGEFDDPDTLFRRIRTWLARPVVRTTVAALVVVEAGAFGGWVYVAHGDHIVRLTDQAISAMHGEQVVYAPECGKRGERRLVRIVVADATGRANP